MGRKAVGFRVDDPRALHGFRVKLPTEPESVAPPAETEIYEGPYEVRPTPSGRTMPTEGKLMAEDMTVQPIPYYEVSNNAGGETVYIGV